MINKEKAFTLIELLVVIAIIGILAGILFVAINPSDQINKANSGKVVKEMEAIKQAVTFYVLDTNEFPPDCRLNCTEETDPFLTAPTGTTGWRGPYLTEGLWNRKHPWGGQMGILLYDSNNNGRPEVWVVLDDDAPGTNWSDNSGKIPEEYLAKIDEQVDNGDLSSGDMFLGDNKDTGGVFAEGEGAWRVYRVGEQN